ncbi:MAG: DUF4837 family protein [Bacteroidota bacterium]
MQSYRTVAQWVGILAVVGFLFAGCDGDYRKNSIGSHGDLLVVMDSTQFESETADAIRETFGAFIRTIPSAQPKFDLQFTDFTTEEKLEQIKRTRNVLIATPLDAETNVGTWVRSMLGDRVEESVRQGENFSFPMGDQWYRNQWAAIVTSTSDSALANKIRRGGESLVQDLVQLEIERWKYEIYERGEQLALEDSLWDQHGWKIRVQHDYQLNIDTTFNEGETGLITMRRFLPKNDRWIWAWWDNEFTDIGRIDSAWITQKRDSLMKLYIRGSRDDSYVQTSYNRPYESTSLEINGYYTIESRGIWRMTNDAMAGPFVNYVIYDDKQQRLFMLEFAQFAPRYDKRRFVRQFEAMARTFQSDSTWNERQ